MHEDEIENFAQEEDQAEKELKELNQELDEDRTWADWIVLATAIIFALAGWYIMHTYR